MAESESETPSGADEPRAPDDAALGASGVLRAARPESDDLRKASARARAERALFGAAPPATLGRFVLLDAHAAGGMGVVHAAYDPVLDRKVALKVLHPHHRLDQRARARVLVEARALAKLDHPHVVKVHDVLEHRDQAVIVMEWLDGETLATRFQTADRDWREIVAAYVQAARGLAAAHAVDVIHRDFKPSNGIVMADGRVKVLDFGLARTLATRDADRATTPTAQNPELTNAGDVVGTLAYCAPEQLAGGAATAASDQFSFGVSLHRALEDRPPFELGDAPTLRARIERGGIARSGRDLPAWLRAVIARTLAADPAARFPSLDAVIAALTRPRGWRRWRIAALACALVAAPTAVAVAQHLARPPRETCDGGATLAAAAWGPAEHARVADVLTQIGTPYALAIRAPLAARMDQYRDAWAAGHRDACLAHERGEQSDLLLDRRMRCLQHRLDDLRASAATLASTDLTSVGNVMDVVARMPTLRDCSDVDRLADEGEQPSAEQRDAVAATEAQLSVVRALSRAGRYSGASVAAWGTLTLARLTGYAPLVARAWLELGRALQFGADPAALATLRDARGYALAHGALRVAVEAAARTMYVEATNSSTATALVEREADIFLPLSQMLVGDHFARPLLLNNLGVARMAAGDHDGARGLFQQARDELAGVADPDLELTAVDMNLALLTSEGGPRERLARSAWERMRDVVGPSHLQTLTNLETYASLVEDPALISDLLEPACAGYDEFYPEHVEDRVACRRSLAYLAEHQGDNARAGREYRACANAIGDASTPSLSAERRIATGFAALFAGDRVAARASLTEEYAAEASHQNWWVRLRAADAALGLAQLQANYDITDRNLVYVDFAIAQYAAARDRNAATEYRLRLADARALRATIVRNGGNHAHTKGP